MPKKPKMDVVQNAVDVARTVTDDSYKPKLKRTRKTYRIDVLNNGTPRDADTSGARDGGGLSA